MIDIVIVFTIIYLGISIAVYFFQDYILFRPEKLPKEFNFDYKNLVFDEYLVEIKPGVKISGLRFKCINPKGVVFYLKGNSKSIKGWGKFAIDFLRYDYEVIMIDYRGYGKSTGIRTQKEINEDLQLIYNKIKEKVDEKYIILYGRSMGSGFATKLASMNSPRMLILDAPYYSMSKTTSRYLPFLPMSWLLKFPIPTYKWIKYVKCPIHILHGTKDKLIPFSSSIKLATINSYLSCLHPIIGGGHNNLHNFESYHKTLSEIFKMDNLDFNKELSSISFTRKKR
ncbi:MAG: alpha/beta fold hydrolase [Saprospiraceae bacterium]|nr:alpha/beta fold hydrolase [Saprospiraceae bacterium]MBK6566076.1 alpha/beta fold hydrolase [Saprospiraceae bacterium]MBK7525752.1 alpha/beta fold hydrolase [Saprospiraceae bacterium]MBK8080744.1 alpha/beta fold hydrolase [Saprospiraceae bacterium]MBK8369906.1 alpha/beta fold hydrolase [Saprospiraceae bacterium]